MSDGDKAMVECSTVGFRSLADGTVRFTIDVEPLNRDTALKAFSQPGTACVLAVLTNEVAKKEMVQAEESKAGNPEKSAQARLFHKENNNRWPSNVADAMCRENNFYKYLPTIGYYDVEAGYDSLDKHLKYLSGDILSKKELDTNSDALSEFLKLLADYRKFVQEI